MYVRYLANKNDFERLDTMRAQRVLNHERPTPVLQTDRGAVYAATSRESDLIIERLVEAEENEELERAALEIDRIID